jgi:hypothetical protein
MDISGVEDEFRLSRSLPRLLYVKSPAPDREARKLGTRYAIAHAVMVGAELRIVSLVSQHFQRVDCFPFRDGYSRIWSRCAEDRVRRHSRDKRASPSATVSRTAARGDSPQGIALLLVDR